MIDNAKRIAGHGQITHITGGGIVVVGNIAAVHGGRMVVVVVYRRVGVIYTLQLVVGIRVRHGRIEIGSVVEERGAVWYHA